MEKSKILIVVGLIVCVLVVLLVVNFSVKDETKNNSDVAKENSSAEVLQPRDKGEIEEKNTNIVENKVENKVENTVENEVIDNTTIAEDTTKVDVSEEKVLYSYVSGDNSAAKGNPEILDVYEKTDKVLRFKYHAPWLEKDVIGSADKASEGNYSYKDGNYEITFELNSLGDGSIKVSEFKNGELNSWKNLFTDYTSSEENKTENQNAGLNIINGKYENNSKTENYYHSSTLTIKNATEDSMEFEISAAHGRDVDHVNIGELKKSALKIDVPEDMKIPESTQYAYEFTEEIDGKTNKIIFVYTAHRQFAYVNVKEEYSTTNNPYAGHNVFFEGEYEKVSNE